MLQTFIFLLLLGSTLARENGAKAAHSSKKASIESITTPSARASFIRNMTKTAFGAYQRHAWGHDYLLPVTESFENRNAFDLVSSSSTRKKSAGSTSNGETILEALPTLWIMGLKEEFALARDWLLAHHLNNSWFGDLAPLLSGHALTGDTRFLQRAIEVADHWLPRYRQLDKLTGNNIQLLWSSPELKYLAQVTGHVEKYFDAVDADYDRYKKSLAKEERSDFAGFRRMFIELAYFIQEEVPDSSNLLQFRQALTKMTASKGGSGNAAGDLSGVPRLRTGTQPPFRAYIATDITKKMAGDDCTYAGLFALASSLFTSNGYGSKPDPKALLGLARALAETCHQAARSSSTGLPPRTFYFDVPGAVNKLDGSSIIGTGGYELSPHLAQTYFLLHRVTGDRIYQQMAWELVVAIEKYCKVTVTESGGVGGGYSSVKSVNFEGGDDGVEHLDIQPPEFIGATLKYLYLIFDDESAENRFPVDQWVFTLSGHPIRAHAKKVTKRKCLF